jgi:hypothetical protein
MVLTTSFHSAPVFSQPLMSNKNQLHWVFGRAKRLPNLSFFAQAIATFHTIPENPPSEQK